MNIVNESYFMGPCTVYTYAVYAVSVLSTVDSVIWCFLIFISIWHDYRLRHGSRTRMDLKHEMNINIKFTRTGLASINCQNDVYFAFAFTATSIVSLPILNNQKKKKNHPTHHSWLSISNALLHFVLQCYKNLRSWNLFAHFPS